MVSECILNACLCFLIVCYIFLFLWSLLQLFVRQNLLHDYGTILLVRLWYVSYVCNWVHFRRSCRWLHSILSSLSSDPHWNPTIKRTPNRNQGKGGTGKTHPPVMKVATQLRLGKRTTQSPLARTQSLSYWLHLRERGNCTACHMQKLQSEEQRKIETTIA